MSLDVAELKAIEALVVKIKALTEDALTISASANDAGATRTLKALLIRVVDTEANIQGRIKSAGQP
jgi:hypothetical protein